MGEPQLEVLVGVSERRHEGLVGANEWWLEGLVGERHEGLAGRAGKPRLKAWGRARSNLRDWLGECELCRRLVEAGKRWQTCAIGVERWWALLLELHRDSHCSPPPPLLTLGFCETV